MRLRSRTRVWFAVTAGALFATAIHGSASAQDTVEEKDKLEADSDARKGNLDITVQFAFDSAALDDTAKAGLVELATWAKEHADREIVIAGHTDETGSAAYNQELGERRAASARQFLVGQGVDGTKISIVSYGEEMPASASAKENRRAVFVSQMPEPVAEAPAPEPVPEPLPEPPPAPAPALMEEEEESRGPGMSFVVGGGVSDFIDSGMSDATNTAGAWEARFTYGTRSWVGIEAAYVGSAQSINALGLDDNAMLIGSAGETALRVNIPNIPYITPFAVAGIGVSYYSLANSDFNTSNVEDDETAVHFPLGLGLDFHSGAFLFDVRGVYRPATEDDMRVTQNTDEGGEGLDTWSATAHAGVVF